MSVSSNGVEAKSAPSIQVKGLSYAFPDGSSGLKDVALDLPPGSRTLLIGGELPHAGKPYLVLPFNLSSSKRRWENHSAPSAFGQTTGTNGYSIDSRR